MKQCMCVRIYSPQAKTFLHDYIPAQAKKNQIEGIGQLVAVDQVQLFACAQPEVLEAFLDELYASQQSLLIERIEIEPCSIDRDFRGVFRILE